MAILSSFQLVFHTVALQKKGEEVWKVLSAAKQQFDKFGELISTVEKQVGTVQNTLGKIGQKTRTINRSLKSVTTEDLLPDGGSDVPQLLPALAAVGAEEEFSDEEE
jgi:DNA recombination protein RmuC